MHPMFIPHVPVRLALAVGAAEHRLHQYFPRLVRVLTRSSPARAAPFEELQRIESDPAFRALFRAELSACIVQSAEAALTELRQAIRPDSEERAA
ncbi:hypothetical protein OG730_15010 [Streptomyces sp. NBC_01298]|uniref:hypothetical protein n=1 Tax=Streptomyces sp. NBC_01298 TaxID=2903817 RepID=UPI002E15A8C2|nr:hypothetical protein OG730_15010 [Streptomyces sp. NBC_01298]